MFHLQENRSVITASLSKKTNSSVDIIVTSGYRKKEYFHSFYEHGSKKHSLEQASILLPKRPPPKKIYFLNQMEPVKQCIS